MVEPCSLVVSCKLLMESTISLFDMFASSSKCESNLRFLLFDWMKEGDMGVVNTELLGQEGNGLDGQDGIGLEERDGMGLEGRNGMGLKGRAGMGLEGCAGMGL